MERYDPPSRTRTGLFGEQKRFDYPSRVAMSRLRNLRKSSLEDVQMHRVCKGCINASYYVDDSWTCGGTGVLPLGFPMRYHQTEKHSNASVTWILFVVDVFDN
jgi:hypothetical protein